MMGLGAGVKPQVAKAAAVTKTIADVASNLSAVYLEQGPWVEIGEKLGSRWIKVVIFGHFIG